MTPATASPPDRARTRGGLRTGAAAGEPDAITLNNSVQPPQQISLVVVAVCILHQCDSAFTEANGEHAHGDVLMIPTGDIPIRWAVTQKATTYKARPDRLSGHVRPGVFTKVLALSHE